MSIGFLNIFTFFYATVIPFQKSRETKRTQTVRAAADRDFSRWRGEIGSLNGAA